ncbi:hypothetical protein RJ639_024321 [Escallonia herrerae]|uniref:Peptidase S8/S53 domain-containing protein n=1 Tax=Escallonia herrerae TaxID=1293975 RepID=A0AA89ADX2_9ASTE|nr:hypothetical protein RJ639_024321 [Escallonia herrerae]
MYKVGWATDTGADTAASDILAAMDQAIMDGVDIMSLSIGLGPAPYFEDPIAIASLSEVERGILVTCAAGNDAFPSTTENGAPWIATVGASTIGRSFVGTLKLGNGISLKGTSYFPQSVLVSDALLYYGKGNVTKAMCQNLDTEEVSGEVVFCDNNNGSDILGQINEVQRAGASAGIFVAEMADYPVLYSFPSLVLKIGSGTKVKDYATGAMKQQWYQSHPPSICFLHSKPSRNINFGMDPSNPYFVHYSNHSGHLLVPIKLNGANYPSWNKSMIHALTTKNKIGFINGSIEQPSKKDQPTEYALWNQCNIMVLSWLTHSCGAALDNIYGVEDI